MSVDGVGAYIFINMDQKHENSGLRGKEVCAVSCVASGVCPAGGREYGRSQPGRQPGLLSSVFL